MKADSPTALAGPSLELERARRRLRLPGRLRRMEVGTTFVIVLLVGVVLTSLVESPLQGRPYEALEFTTYGLPTVTAHDELLQQVLGEIPAGASVLTTTSIFPELSSRLNAYVLPITSYFHGNLTFTNVLDTDLNHSTYVVFDCYLDHFDCWILQALAHLSTHAPPFGLLVEEQGIYVFEQGYVGTPRTWVPYSVTLPGWDLRNPHYAEYSVPEGSGGPGLGVPSGLSPGATGLLYGPDLPYLPPGTYQLTFTLTNAGSGSPLTFEAFEQPVNVSVVPTNVSPGGHDYAVEESLGEMQAVGSATSGGEGESTATLNVPWEDPAVLWVNGQEGPSPVGFVLSSFTVTQLSY